MNDEFAKEIALPGCDAVLRLTADFNCFELKGEERELVFKIVDMMDEFVRKTSGEKS